MGTKIRRMFIKGLKINAALYGTALGVTLYYYPELRKEPM